MHLLPGKSRILYKASGFTTGLTITVKLRNSDNLIEYPEIYLTEIADGIYYFDYTWPVGKFIGIFKENGVKKAVEFFTVSTVPGFINYIVNGY